ncbi:MAG TPA: DUF6328 family protein [Pyrinomonadaceae bacterium]|nr:DUF6328 family protein [Pyrinomonadaceae bacterium]
MAELKDKVQYALDEGRILILGAHLLIGFQFRAFLEEGYERLPFSSQLLMLVALWLLLAALTLLVAPTAYHRIVERGEDTVEIHAYATRAMTWALLPFALALGIDVYVAAAQVGGSTVGAVAGFGALVAALFFWYGLEVGARTGAAASKEAVKVETEEGRGAEKAQDATAEKQTTAGEQEAVGQGVGGQAGGTKLGDRIKHVLTEARMVLPGVQALLGFQLIATLMPGFEKLPALSQYVHLASLALVALSIVLLMTPAAYHRIVERGEETEHFHTFAGRLVVAALVPLALGIAGGLYVVMEKVTGSLLVSVVAAVVMLAVFYEFWFGITLYRRFQRQHERPRRRDGSLFGA